MLIWIYEWSFDFMYFHKQILTFPFFLMGKKNDINVKILWNRNIHRAGKLDSHEIKFNRLSEENC